MLYEPGDLRLIECERPKAGKGEVLIKNEVSLTCGSDVKSYIRGYAKHTPPYNIGHECSGIVAEVGEGVTKFKVGDRVVAHNSAPCNECYYCKKRDTLHVRKSHYKSAEKRRFQRVSAHT